MKGFVTGLLCAALIALTPTIIMADTEGQAAQEAVTKHNDNRNDGNRRICKRVKKTGSHMLKRVCRKQRDWDRITTESQETVNRINDRAQGSGVGPADG